LKKNKTEFEEESICINCVNAMPLDGNDACICSIAGAVRADGSCKKFRLDLLKVQPNMAKIQMPQGKTNFLSFFEKST